jgi:transposase InsO family protein
MTAFLANKHYYELTLYIDLFNNEIDAYYLSNKKGNPDAYLIGMSKLIEEKNKKYTDLEMILHSGQGSMYCSKRFNESLYLYNIIYNIFLLLQFCNKKLPYRMIRQFLNSDYSFSSTNLPLKSGSIIGKPSFSTDSLITSPPILPTGFPVKVI